jgi:hypothetical protein
MSVGFALRRLERARVVLVSWFGISLFLALAILGVAAAKAPPALARPIRTAFDWAALMQTHPAVMAKLLWALLFAVAANLLIIAPLFQAATLGALRGTPFKVTLNHHGLGIWKLNFLRLALQAALLASWYFSARWAFGVAHGWADERWQLALQALIALPYLFAWISLSMLMAFAAGFIVVRDLPMLPALEASHRRLLRASFLLARLWAVPVLLWLAAAVAMIELQITTLSSTQALLWVAPIVLLQLAATGWGFSVALLPAEAHGGVIETADR